MSLLVEGCPSNCPRGHPFGPGRVLIGWRPCSCARDRGGRGGHRTFTCVECDAVIYDPPHEPAYREPPIGGTDARGSAP